MFSVAMRFPSTPAPSSPALPLERVAEFQFLHTEPEKVSLMLCNGQSACTANSRAAARMQNLQTKWMAKWVSQETQTKYTEHGNFPIAYETACVHEMELRACSWMVCGFRRPNEKW